MVLSFPLIMSALVAMPAKSARGQTERYIAPMIGAAVAAAVYMITHAPSEVLSVKEAEGALGSERAERTHVASVKGR
jgi:hypothetical protein